MSIGRDGGRLLERRAAVRAGSILLVALGLMLCPIAPASAFWGTRGYAGARATFAAWDESIYQTDERIFFNRAVSASQTMTDFASSADATHGASLAAGLLWVHTRAEHEDRYGDADARASAALFDFIYLDVPAGFYPAGISLSIDGRFTGQVDVRGDLQTTADVHWQAVLELNTSEEDSVFGRVQLSASDSPTVDGTRQQSIDEPFGLTVELYPPGSTVDTGFVIPVRYYMSLGDNEDLSLGTVRSISFEGDVTSPTPGGEATIDMLSTAAITSITVVGDGVTWESESGVLLPEPGIALSLFVGGMSVALLARRRRD